jgi:UDP-3-O-[3-hydroxymyristoyl] glucosamine N-acyltransferase
MKLSELVQKLGSGIVSSNLEAGDPEILGVAAIDKATSTMLSYAESLKFAAQLEQTQAGAVILPMNEALQAIATERGIPWIATKQPRLMFAQAIAGFYQPFKPTPAIHPTAVIDPTTEIGKEVAIGAHVVIQAGARIGDHVCIHPNVVVYPNAQIGDRTVLHANCTIHERTQIGADCVIHAGAVIGSEGFGFVPTQTVWLYRFRRWGRSGLQFGS